MGVQRFKGLASCALRRMYIKVVFFSNVHGFLEMYCLDVHIGPLEMLVDPHVQKLVWIGHVF